MTINPHLTDQYLATVRKSSGGEVVDAVVPELVEMLRDGLPGVDQRLLGEIVLHVGIVASKLSMTLEERATNPAAAQGIAAVTAVAITKAGEQLYAEGAK